MPWYLGVLLTVFVPLIGLNLYVGWKLTSSISQQFRLHKRRTGFTLGSMLVVLHSLPLAAIVTFWFVGRDGMAAFSGENQIVDILLVYPFWTTLIIIVQTALLFLLWDIVRVIAVRIFRASKERWTVANRRMTLAITGVVILYSLPTLFIQTRIPRVNEQTVTISERYRDLDGLRILHISDVQGDGRTDRTRVRDFVRLANELDADLVMNSGDIVTTGDAYIDQTAEELSKLKARVGMYAAVGDHDIFTGNKLKVIAAIREAHHIMLEDTSIIIPYQSVSIGLTFVTYTYREKPTSAQLDSILTVLPDSVFKVLLVHQPAMPLVANAIEREYDLVLAGHTHGGGVAFGLPGFGFLAPASFETRYIGGLYQVGQTYINVTTGLGFTLAPVRFNAPIEISMLTLSVEGS